MNLWPSDGLLTCLFAYLILSVCTSFLQLPACLSVCLPVCLSVCLSVYFIHIAPASLFSSSRSLSSFPPFLVFVYLLPFC